MPPKKKLTKKEKARIEAEAAEQLRIEMERERLRKVEEERARHQKERREAEKRQSTERDELRTRNAQLRESLYYFADMKAKIKEIYRLEKIEREWDHYLRCNGLPDTRKPAELRKYLYMWKQAFEKRIGSEMNWLLLTNEQSVLTQDQTVPNMTYENLRTKQVVLGDYYAGKLKEALGILEEMEFSISEEDLSDLVIQDLQNLKAEFRILLRDFVDDFSYRILLNINRDMKLDGLSIATHEYESDIFKTQIYTTKDIPQPIILNPKEKSREDSKPLEINFEKMKVELILPPSIKCVNSAIRALWVDYDHFSDYCKTVELPYEVDLTKSLRKVTKAEWGKRKEFLKMVVEELLEDKPQPEENPDDPDADQPRKVPDVDRLYTEYEDSIRKEERERKGPQTLNLGEFEVNLRSHRTIAGIYHFDYLEQPLQHIKLTPKCFIRTLPQPSRLVHKDFHQEYIPPPPVDPGVRRLPEEIEAELKMVESNFAKLVQVTLDLPETVFWFEPPVICRWEPLELEAPAAKEAKKKKEKKPLPVKIVEDFNLLELPCNNQLQSLIVDFVTPKIPDGYGVKISNFDPEVLRAGEGKIKLNEVEIAPPLGKLIYETKSPSFLHPSYETKKILRVVSKRGSQESSELVDYDDSEPVENPDLNENVYMFSRFMRDLDDLVEARRPCFERKIPQPEPEEEPEIQEPEESEESHGMDPFPSEISLLKLDDLDINQALLLTRDSAQDLFRQRNEPDPKDLKEPSDDDESSDEEEPYHEETARKKFRSKRLNGRWSTEDVHDVKYNEDKLQMQFRIGRLGVFGLAAPKYSNFPFQGWDVKPDLKNPGEIIFSITASIMTAEFMINRDGIRLNSIQGGIFNPLEYCMGKIYPIKQMIRMMHAVSADIFPDDDAFYYVDGMNEKNPYMEYHLYNCMGPLLCSHNFGWSRWNSQAGSRSAVLLMRELLENKKVPNFLTLLVTPLKACIVDCTEVSSAYTTAPVPGMDYFADLYHLAQVNSLPVSREKQEKMDPKLRENITFLLKSVRPLSFS